MTKVLNFGSVNIDHVYVVDHFVRPGETLSSRKYQVFAGGKGFNQSIALARAGAQVMHAGNLGRDGQWLHERLRSEGVDTSFLRMIDQPSGHAVIQVNPEGENAIFLFAGANHCLTTEEIDEALGSTSPGDLLLVQNETNAVAEILQRGAERKLRMALNPAPMTADVLLYPLKNVSLFIINETEAQALTGESDPEKVRAAMISRFPQAATVLTLGSQGAMYFDATTVLRQPSKKVAAIDTTAAGDTFIGFFLADLLRHGEPHRALAVACHAAAICVTKPGAADSIPFLKELT